MLSYSRSLSDLKNRSEKIAEREQNLIIFSAIVFPIAEKISELWAAQVFLQPIPFKSDRLLGTRGVSQNLDRPLIEALAFRLSGD